MNSATGETAPPGPVPSDEGERLGGLDVLRGLAVLGILVPNIMGFGQPLEATFMPGFFRVDPGPWSDDLWAIQFVLVDGKMRGLFALLFGAGLALFIDRSLARGAGRSLVVRRLLVLAAFGAAHAVFLWAGDILWLYALVGLAVVPFLALAREQLLVIGVLGAIVGAALSAATSLPAAFVDPAAPGEKEIAALLAGEAALAERDAAAEAAVISGGDYAGFVARNWDYFSTAPVLNLLYAGAELFPLMILGAALLRYGLFAGGAQPPALRAAAWAGLIIGGGASALIAGWAMARGLDYWTTGAAFAGWAPLPALAMTLSLALLLAPWAARARGVAARLLAGAGRTAFTNYIGTSAVMMIVFHGWGLGLFGTLGRIELYGVAALTWAGMLAWPQWWLARYRFGPLEWLWRCLTYGRLFPLREQNAR